MPKWLFGDAVFPGICFDADSGGGGAGGGEGEKKPEPKFSQEDVDRLVGEARKNGRETGVSKLLEGLGVKDPDELKTLLESGKRLQENQKTELEKLADRTKAAEEKATKVLKEADDKLAAMRRRILDSEIKVLAGKTIMDKEGKAVVRQAFKPEALDDVLVLLDRSGIKEADDKYEGIDKALETLAKAKPWMLADQERKSIGSPKSPEKKADGKAASAQPIIRSL